MKTLHLVSVWPQGNRSQERQFLVGNNINVSSMVKAIFHQVTGLDESYHLERASANSQFPLLYTVTQDVTVSGWISTYKERQPQWHIRVDTLPAAPHIKVVVNGAEELESLKRSIRKALPTPVCKPTPSTEVAK